MYILIDSRIPEKAKDKLTEYGELIELPANNVVYSAISSHPDIFCCKTPETLIVAPDFNFEILKIFEEKNLNYVLGDKKLSKIYPHTAYYNAVVTPNYLIHNLQITDISIQNQSKKLTKIHVNQGYVRCNLIALDNNFFITSDKGIYNELHSLNPNKVFYVNPKSIILPNFKHGFFGGCCGYHNKTLFILGNIKYLPENYELSKFIENSGNCIVNLCEQQLFDGGGIFFISK